MQSQNSNESRRRFLKNSFIAGSIFPLMNSDLSAMFNSFPAERLKIHVFSKHLQFLNYRDMAEAVAEMKFDGIDLTVRPDGHVKPERVESDLPAAVEAMRNVNLAPSMMVTAVQDASNSTDKKVLEVAAKLGFQYYRMKWYPYPEGKSMPESLQDLARKVKDLSLLNKKLGLTGCYQNHSGMLVGASVWELWQLVKDAEKEHMGIQYDIRHATVEGGLSWQNGLRLIQPDIKTIAIKDFKWKKKNGEWIAEDTPL